MKSLMKMVRQFGESIITLVVSIILFLFNAVKYIVSLPARSVSYIREFLADTDSVLKESLIALSICAVGDLCAGIILGNMEFFLQTYPGLMVIIPGAIGDEASALTDCFQDNLLAPPVYTRPAEFNGWRVPDVLLSGNFAEIEKWQEEQAYVRTKELRPDLLDE